MHIWNRVPDTKHLESDLIRFQMRIWNRVPDAHLLQIAGGRLRLAERFFDLQSAICNPDRKVPYKLASSACSRPGSTGLTK